MVIDWSLLVGGSLLDLWLVVLLVVGVTMLLAAPQLFFAEWMAAMRLVMIHG